MHVNGSTARRPQRPARGFTLVELMITVAVLAVVAGLAAPLFAGVINGNRLTSTANELAAGIQSARMEALRRGVRVSLCQSTNGTTCSTTSPWRGWLVFADANGNNAPDAGEITQVGTIEAPLRVTNSSNLANARLTFRADGIAYSADTLLTGNIRVCMPATNPPRNARDVNIAPGGRVSVRNPAAGVGASCPAAVN